MLLIFLFVIFCGSMINATETTTTSKATREIVTIAEPSRNARGIVFQILYQDTDYRVDLNSDGVMESVSLKYEDTQYDLIVNGVAISLLNDGNSYQSEWIVLCDLDVNDRFLDLIFRTSSEEQHCNHFFYFNGEKLIKRGTIWTNYLVFPEDAAYTGTPFDLDAERVDGHGGLIDLADYRCGLGSFIVIRQPWQIAPNGLLEEVQLQGYLQIENVYMDYMNELLRMKMDLPLYASPTDAEPSLMAKAGETFSLVQFNDCWVQLQTQDAQLGWFRLKAYSPYLVMVGYDEYIYSDVFDGFLSEGE